MRFDGLQHIEGGQGFFGAAKDAAASRGLRVERRLANGAKSEQVISHLYEYSPGPLPLGSAELETQGGLLYFYCAGSAQVSVEQAARQHLIGAAIWVAGIRVGDVAVRATQPGRQIFTARFAVSDLAAGLHGVEMRPLQGTETGPGDLFHLVTVEFRRQAPRVQEAESGLDERESGSGRASGSEKREFARRLNA